MGCNRARESGRLELEISPAIHRCSRETGDASLVEGGYSLKQIEKMLAEARAKRSWGQIVIELKEGRAVLIRQTIQHKVEDYPATNEQTHP